MTDQELIAYFEKVTLPETLRINRAITQFNVKEAVDRNIEMMGNDPKKCRGNLKAAVGKCEDIIHVYC